MFTFRSLGGTALTSAPRSTIRPSSGSSKPAIMRSVVVFPQPDGPSRQKNEPSGMAKDKSFTAVKSPNFFCRF
jgi:hypothetical protein